MRDELERQEEQVCHFCLLFVHALILSIILFARLWAAIKEHLNEVATVNRPNVDPQLVPQVARGLATEMDNMSTPAALTKTLYDLLLWTFRLNERPVAVREDRERRKAYGMAKQLARDAREITPSRHRLRQQLYRLRNKRVDAIQNARRRQRQPNTAGISSRIAEFENKVRTFKATPLPPFPERRANNDDEGSDDDDSDDDTDVLVMSCSQSALFSVVFVCLLSVHLCLLTRLIKNKLNKRRWTQATAHRPIFPYVCFCA